MGKRNKAQMARKRRHARVRRSVVGTLERPRLNVYRSLGNIHAQVIDDSCGQTLAAASTVDSSVRGDLAGKAKTEQAALVGEVLAERSLKVGVSQVVFDRGGYKYHGRVKALAEAARKHGLKF